MQYPDLYEDIRNGLSLNLANPIQLDIFMVYVLSQMMASNYYFSWDLTSGYQTTAKWILEYQLKNNSSWSAYLVTHRNTNLTTRLRPLQLIEKTSRGCLASDCSSHTRLTRGLEPHHIFYAIESLNPYKPLGQIELVLGVDEETGKKIAFIERFQLTKDLPEVHFAGIVEALNRAAKNQGYTLTLLTSMNKYYVLGHNITNIKSIERRLRTALQNYFSVNSTYKKFKKHKDTFKHQNEDFVYIAERLQRENYAVESHSVDLEKIKELNIESIKLKTSGKKYNYLKIWKSMQKGYLDYVKKRYNKKNIFDLNITIPVLNKEITSLGDEYLFLKKTELANKAGEQNILEKLKYKNGLMDFLLGLEMATYLGKRSPELINALINIALIEKEADGRSLIVRHQDTLLHEINHYVQKRLDYIPQNEIPRFEHDIVRFYLPSGLEHLPDFVWEIILNDNYLLETYLAKVPVETKIPAYVFKELQQEMLNSDNSR